MMMELLIKKKKLLLLQFTVKDQLVQKREPSIMIAQLKSVQHQMSLTSFN